MATRNLKCRGWWRNALPAVLSLLLLGRAAEAVDDQFYNNALYDPATLQNAQITATNFLNDSGGTFSINFMVFNLNWPTTLYQGWSYTRSFINYGEMDCDTGFWFDTHFGSYRSEADSFYNPGIINCDTNGSALLNINDVPWGGGINVSASNIVMSGTINVGGENLARFTGNYLDFTRGTVVIQNPALTISTANSVSLPNVVATGQTSTNGSFYPASDLTQTYAFSGGAVLDLVNSTPYFDIQPNGPSNYIVRAVFLENDNSNVTANVYFAGVDDGIGGLCGSPHGYAHVEWVGSYFDPTVWGTSTSYLYLDDDYIQGSLTNILSYTPPGLPCNYDLTETSVQNDYGVPPAPSTFPLIYPTSPYPPDFVITNIYSYVSAQFMPLSYQTNAQLQITNLPGRVELTASNELNLTLTHITSENYVLLRSTNQFDYDGQSLISTPYSDIYLGCTNGSFALTNAILPNVPRWVGTVQAWSTRWVHTETNTIYSNVIAGPIPGLTNLVGITFDYRVEIVGSLSPDAVAPTTPAQEKDVMLYGTNNVTISDQLNIYGNFYINCTNLLLTANGDGAASPDGELNLNSAAINWSTALPRLSILTNNGAIRSTIASLVQYGTVPTPYLSLVNSGIISNANGATIVVGDFENYGSFPVGNGSFALKSQTTTMSNALVTARGTYTNTGNRVLIGGTQIGVGKSFTLVATNVLSDAISTNGNFWMLGSGSAGSGFATGLVLPIKPAQGDLLNTTITNIAPYGTAVTNTWSGRDFGKSNSGFTNNAAIGWLCLDGLAVTPRSYFGFSGTGVSNAIYVDCLELRDAATNAPAGNNSLNPTNLVFNTNLVIYYAQALISGQSAAKKLDHGDNDHLRWVASYAGRFSSTALVNADGTTNIVNAALAAYYGNNPAAFFVSSEVKLSVSVTNVPPKKVKLSWYSILGATNYVYYRTNLAVSTWQPLTNFVSPLSGPISPTNLTVLDAITATPRFYQVQVVPDNALYFPPGY